jgi:MFS family permease
MQSKSPRAQIGILILATSIIQLANGFFSTFISLRIAIEDFGPTISGLVLSSYFAGFTLGALRCERIIERVGHIRAYAALAGMVVAATAAMPVMAGPLPWLILRAVIGFGCSGLSSLLRAGSTQRRSQLSAAGSSQSTCLAPSSLWRLDSY